MIGVILFKQWLRQPNEQMGHQLNGFPLIFRAIDHIRDRMKSFMRRQPLMVQLGWAKPNINDRKKAFENDPLLEAIELMKSAILC